jgi:release factor glutamine methyltransferase
MTLQEASKYIITELNASYDKGESAAIAKLAIEYLSGEDALGKHEGKVVTLSPARLNQLHTLLPRLLQHEPVQYVLNEAWFCGFKFYVDPNVLIPRQETEELVEWIISNCKFPFKELNILDIGTGSGCIAISLKRKLRKAEVSACDISNPALIVAQKNAKDLGASVNFMELDFLDNDQREKLASFDIIVSNPPYVPENDKAQMHANVLQYEPHTALFVPDNDVLVFYKALAGFGKTHLSNTGTLYAEIHENMGKAVNHLFNENGFQTEIKKDMQGKDRMLKAIK